MKSELLAKSPMLALPLVALFLFMAVFIAIFVITMKKRAPAYDPLAHLPFDDESPKRNTESESAKGARS